jgi:hypothetical protein
MEGVVGESIDGWWLPVNRLYINDTQSSEIGIIG